MLRIQFLTFLLCWCSITAAIKEISSGTSVELVIEVDELPHPVQFGLQCLVEIEGVQKTIGARTEDGGGYIVCKNTTVKTIYLT